uniref:Uncharacterized protein n=1 Tax=Solanum lycopersicum TaxID=4081 RepID=A0A3Q7H2D5_SOLLC
MDNLMLLGLKQAPQIVFLHNDRGCQNRHTQKSQAPKNQAISSNCPLGQTKPYSLSEIYQDCHAYQLQQRTVFDSSDQAHRYGFHTPLAVLLPYR